MTAKNLTIIIVEKTGTLKALTVKDFSEEELYKKCGFKKADGFTVHTEWTIKMDSKKYFVSAYGKIDGKANTENKYDFPPPIDNTLFFGSCALVGKFQKEDGTKEYSSLTLEQWEKMYEKLFGGFEDLKVSVLEDDDEEDELDLIPADKKTKNGYLKDGFVVDSDGDEEDEEFESEEEEEDGEGGEDDGGEEEGEDVDEDIGSELSEDEYSDDEDEESEEEKDKKTKK